MEILSSAFKILFVLPKTGRILLKNVDTGQVHEILIEEFDGYSKIYKPGDVGAFKRMESGKIIFQIEGDVQNDIKLLIHEGSV